MRAGIVGPLLLRSSLGVDQFGKRHSWQTIENLVVRKVFEVVYRNNGRASHQQQAQLTEIGMLAALWLEQEATQEIGDG